MPGWSQLSCPVTRRERASPSVMRRKSLFLLANHRQRRLAPPCLRPSCRMFSSEAIVPCPPPDNRTSSPAASIAHASSRAGVRTRRASRSASCATGCSSRSPQGFTCTRGRAGSVRAADDGGALAGFPRRKPVRDHRAGEVEPARARDDGRASGHARLQHEAVLRDRARQPPRRVAFPQRPTPEWFTIDLLEHADMAGVSRADLEAAIARRVASGELDREALHAAASRYGTRATTELVERALASTQGS
jgi:hypothetical protein